MPSDLESGVLLGHPAAVDQQGNAPRGVDDELLALLGLKKVPVKETPAPPTPKPPTFDELMAAVFGTQPRVSPPAVPPSPARTVEADPDVARDFTWLFGPRASEVLGQNVEPINPVQEPDPAYEQDWMSPMAWAADPPRDGQDDLPAPANAPAQVPTTATPAPPSRWTRALQVGSTVMAGAMVVLGVLAIRRRFAELRRLGHSEVDNVRGELKAEIGKLREYVRVNPGAAPMRDQVDRADQELDELFADIDRRHRRST
jgi:hypothetical protein